MTNRLLLALETIVSRFDKQRVPCMIFGGIANSIYGNPRQTFDIDVTRFRQKITCGENRNK